MTTQPEPDPWERPFSQQVDHPNCEGAAWRKPHPSDEWLRYELKDDHKIYNPDVDPHPWTIMRSDDHRANVISNATYDTIVLEARRYYRNGFSFDCQWMVDYLCDNHIRDNSDRAGDVCHDCGKGSFPKDKLFKCSNPHGDCNRSTHHKYACAKAGTHGPDTRVSSGVKLSDCTMPNDPDIEALWCCWKCMFRKTDEAAAWKDERILTKALLRYNKVIPKRNDADARTAAEIAKQVRTRSVAKATRRQRTRAAQGQSKQQAPKRTTQSTRPTQEQQDVLDNEINEPTVRRIARTGLNHLQSQAHQMQDWATNRLNRQNQ